MFYMFLWSNLKYTDMEGFHMQSVNNELINIVITNVEVSYIMDILIW